MRRFRLDDLSVKAKKITADVRRDRGGKPRAVTHRIASFPALSDDSGKVTSGRGQRRCQQPEQALFLQLGTPPPLRRRQSFEQREAALAELDRLRAMPGSEIVGGITPVLPKSAALQGDFGFPFAGPRRVTP